MPWLSEIREDAIGESKTQMTQRPKTVAAHDALENLISQFADPLAFLRELVQNSVDAGSTEIEVSLERQTETDTSDESGVMVIHVDDFGEGMDREIIDNRLTRLFCSGKEEDYTKIGRFGIGFVSVFAIEPDAVCVDTSRGGEHWRILFQKDKTFTRIARDYPVDGTKIQIIKSATKDEFEQVGRRIPDVLSFWCKHVASTVRFNGEPINQPFELDVPCSVSYREEGTEVVVGCSSEKKPLAGFYNRGLTLTETTSPIAGVTFKINSRYLEHTLTRDAVLHDDNYNKAMDIVRGVVDGELKQTLFDRVEAIAAEPAGLADVSYFYHHATRLLIGSSDDGDERSCFRTVSGDDVTVKEARRAARKGILYTSPERSHLTDAVENDGQMVIAAKRQSPVHSLLAAVVGSVHGVLSAGRCFVMPLPAKSSEEKAQFRRLSRAANPLLEAYNFRMSGVDLAHFDYPGSSIAAHIAITQKKVGELTSVDDMQTLNVPFLSKKRTLVVNADHPLTQRLVRLAAHEPELAAYMLLKLFLLRGLKLTPEADAQLATLSVEQRCNRSSG